jgi:hypothetical protein
VWTPLAVGHPPDGRADGLGVHPVDRLLPLPEHPLGLLAGGLLVLHRVLDDQLVLDLLLAAQRERVQLDPVQLVDLVGVQLAGRDQPLPPLGHQGRQLG